ncbi:MAG: electron transfer flavoprotein subunit beta/FixA family protein [Myxococcota bacterium]
MKILVPLKRVADPDNANKVKVPADGSKVDTAGLEWKANPFDEYALETALRLTEDGKAQKKRLGEIVVVTFGPKDTEATLRAALATGADRAIRVETDDDHIDGIIVAKALAKIVAEEKPDLVMLGKQQVDGDTNQVGQILAELLDWPMATFAGTVQEEDGGLLVGREVDGGQLDVRVKLPALVTVDLRVVNPTSVYSKVTDKSKFKYAEGVRFAPLPAIMKARKKPLAVKNLGDLVEDTALRVKYLRYEAPPERAAGVRVPDVDALVDKLKNEAKVL